MRSTTQCSTTCGTNSIGYRKGVTRTSGLSNSQKRKTLFTIGAMPCIEWKLLPQHVGQFPVKITTAEVWTVNSCKRVCSHWARSAASGKNTTVDIKNVPILHSCLSFLLQYFLPNALGSNTTEAMEKGNSRNRMGESVLHPISLKTPASLYCCRKGKY